LPLFIFKGCLRRFYSKRKLKNLERKYER